MIETLALSRDWSAIGVGETLAFPRTSERPAKQLSGSADELLRNISSVLEDLVLSAIDKRATIDFKTARKEAFPKYFEAVIALGSLIRIVVPQNVIEKLNREFFCELEADLREKGLSAFGPALRDQAVFTVWTLRKISDLLSQAASAAKTDLKPTQQVAEIMQQLLTCMIWTRFHVHCLVTSIERERTLYPEVLDLVIDGLRSAVNAYGLSRRLLDALAPLPEPLLAPIQWDDEEEELLNEARRDMLTEFSEAV